MVVGGGLVLSLRLARLFVVSSVCCVFGRGDFLVFFSMQFVYFCFYKNPKKEKKLVQGKTM